MTVFTTLNPADKSTNAVISGGDLTLGTSANADNGARAVHGKTTGKWYFEVQCSATVVGGDSGPAFAILSATFPALGANGAGGLIVALNGEIWYNGVHTATSIGAGFGAGAPLIGFAVDLDNKRLWGRISNHGSGAVWNNSITYDPATNVGGFDISAIVAALYPAGIVANTGDTFTYNFGASAFGLPGGAPSGFQPGWDTGALTLQGAFTDETAIGAGLTLGPAPLTLAAGFIDEAMLAAQFTGDQLALAAAFTDEAAFAAALTSEAAVRPPIQTVVVLTG